jgi:hypothetical protein
MIAEHFSAGARRALRNPRQRTDDAELLRCDQSRMYPRTSEPIPIAGRPSWSPNSGASSSGSPATHSVRSQKPDLSDTILNTYVKL